jgi:hypothetical protein
MKKKVHYATDPLLYRSPGLETCKRILQRLLQGGLQIVVYMPTESVERMGRAGCLAL